MSCWGSQPARHGYLAGGQDHHSATPVLSRSQHESLRRLTKGCHRVGAGAAARSLPFTPPTLTVSNRILTGQWRSAERTLSRVESTDVGPDLCPSADGYPVLGHPPGLSGAPIRRVKSVLSSRHPTRTGPAAPRGVIAKGRWSAQPWPGVASHQVVMMSPPRPDRRSVTGSHGRCSLRFTCGLSRLEMRTGDEGREHLIPRIRFTSVVCEPPFTHRLRVSPDGSTSRGST
jgi:hypothetical protein